MALLALAGPRAEGAIRGGGVRIEGDAEVAQHFRELLAEAQPDFEEELSRVIGDVAARQVANFARGLLDWGRKASGSFAGSVAEFLQEEGRDLPTRTEVDEFLAGVDRVRDDAERLEARLARLEARSARRAPAAGG
jgi:ubiquinone biosynthesis protein UbiJ